MLSPEEIKNAVAKICGNLRPEVFNAVLQQVMHRIAEGFTLEQLTLKYHDKGVGVEVIDDKPAGKPYEAPKPPETTLQKLQRINDDDLAAFTNGAIEAGDPSKASLYAGEMARRIRDGVQVAAEEVAEVDDRPPFMDEPKKKRGRPPKVKSQAIIEVSMDQISIIPETPSQPQTASLPVG